MPSVSGSRRLTEDGPFWPGGGEEGDLFAAIVASADDAIITKTLDGVITSWNPAAEKLFGYAAAEAIGQPIDIIVPPDRRDDVRRIIKDIAQGLQIRHYETVRQDKMGLPFDVSLSVSPIKGPSGEIIGAAKIVRDVTEQKFNERKFELAVEASPSGLLMIDGTGAIVLVNTELERQFGYSRTELIGQSVDMLLPERFARQHEAYRTAFCKAPSARAMGIGRDLFGRRKDDTEFPVEIGLNPITSRDKIAILATVVDITVRKEAERAVEVQNEQLRRSNADLEQFAYVASHDLQEPLRMVASYTQLLEERYRGKLDDRADKYIGYAVEGARRMQSLVRDLLAYSRLSSRERQLKPIDSAAVVSSAVLRLSSQIKEAEAQVTVGPLPVVMSDELELGQIFQNLISNAIKFRDGKIPNIVIGARPVGAMWEFSVKDNGIGIDLRHSDRIFQMFQRLNERGKYEGNGIGLAIAKKIVERQGGKIWFTSEIGKGTTFFFTLRDARSEPRVTSATGPEHAS